MIGMIFDDEILDVAALWAALGRGSTYTFGILHRPINSQSQRQIMHAYGVLACSAFQRACLQRAAPLGSSSQTTRS